MKVNFYLDKPYNPDISPEKVKQELAKVGGKKKNLAQKFWNPSPTALYLFIIRKSKFPQNPKRSVRFSGKRTKRSVQKRKARNTQKAETKVL